MVWRKKTPCVPRFPLSIPVGLSVNMDRHISMLSLSTIWCAFMSTDSSGSSALDEWKETRDVLKRFDEDLHDLRKYGFIFLASLLTADSFQAYFNLPALARCALLIITLVFIVALRLMDHHYKNFEEATVIRSRILEASLNFELSEIIDVHYKQEGWGKFISQLYNAFILITILLGAAILFPSKSSLNATAAWSFFTYFLPFLIAALIALWFINYVSNSLKIQTRRSDFDDLNDWIVDKGSCVQGENVRISVTNPDPKEPTVIPAGAKAFQILDDEDAVVHEETVKKEITLVDYGTFAWLWNTSGTATEKVVPDKIYRVLPYGRKGRPLRRSIAVYRKDGAPNQEPPKQAEAQQTP